MFRLLIGASLARPIKVRTKPFDIQLAGAGVDRRDGAVTSYGKAAAVGADAARYLISRFPVSPTEARVGLKGQRPRLGLVEAP